MTDEQTAAAIVADPMNAVSETAMEAAIVRALQQARESAIDTHANAAVLRMCHEARMCNGIVDYSDPNATGRVRRVMGTLPMTADGCVVGDGAYVWFMMPKADGSTYAARAMYRKAVCMDPDAYTDRQVGYSTREAAEAAKEAK